MYNAKHKTSGVEQAMRCHHGNRFEPQPSIEDQARSQGHLHWTTVRDSKATMQNIEGWEERKKWSEKQGWRAGVKLPELVSNSCIAYQIYQRIPLPPDSILRSIIFDSVLPHASGHLIRGFCNIFVGAGN